MADEIPTEDIRRIAKECVGAECNILRKEIDEIKKTIPEPVDPVKECEGCKTRGEEIKNLKEEYLPRAIEQSLDKWHEEADKRWLESQREEVYCSNCTETTSGTYVKYGEGNCDDCVRERELANK